MTHRPMSNAALRRERDLETRCRQLLITSCGVHDPHVILVEEEPDRVVVLYTVETLTGRAAHTAFVEAGGDITTVVGFVF